MENTLRAAQEEEAEKADKHPVWEYATISVHWNYVDTELKNYGQDGWELVSVVKDGAYERELYFKRLAK